MEETIGERILRLRNSKAWSRPELGREMAKAIGKDKPWSGEAVRRWEKEIDQPGRDVRAALAKVFDRSEAYIEFGDPPRAQQLREKSAEYNAPSQDAMEIARTFDELDSAGRQYVRDHLALFKRWRGRSAASPHDVKFSEGAVTHQPRQTAKSLEDSRGKGARKRRVS